MVSSNAKTLEEPDPKTCWPVMLTLTLWPGETTRLTAVELPA